MDGDDGKMSESQSGNLLSRTIGAVLRQQSTVAPTQFAANARTLARTGVALALLQAPAASAVTLGALELKSSLGQPFRATTTATIARGETLQAGCIATSPPRTSSPIGCRRWGFALVRMQSVQAHGQTRAWNLALRQAGLVERGWMLDAAGEG